MVEHVRFGSKADMCSAQADVRLVPIADMTSLVIASTGWLLSREETLNVHRFVMG